MVRKLSEKEKAKAKNNKRLWNYWSVLFPGSDFVAKLVTKSKNWKLEQK